MDITLFLAIWGAVLSTYAIGWNIFRDYNDKGKLDISFYIANVFNNAQLEDDVILYRITNVGKKPITIIQAGGGFSKREHFLIYSINIPRLLNPTEYMLVEGKDFTIFNKELLFLGVWDSTGKIWKVKKKVQKYWTNKYLNGINKKK